METLPPEMVEQIVRYLPAQDMVSCSAVSRSWRETFNQDWLWKPRCDPALEESLRTTTCVVKPAFETPEVVNSTCKLTPICKWKLAFMREKHLWRNWKHKNVRIENIPKSERSCCSFLTNTLCVTMSWTREVIEIWDVSVIPASLVATTSVGSIHGPFTTVGNRWIIVDKSDVIKVFFVDIAQNCIELKHDICPDESLEYFYTNDGDTHFVTKQKSVDGRFFLLTASGSDLIIYDLEKREPIKRVCCPEIENDYVHKVIVRIYDLPKCDDMLVFIKNKHDDSRHWSEDTVLPYIYSLRQQRYLPGPISEALTGQKPAINDHHVCLHSARFLTIVDYHTSEVLLKIECQDLRDVLAFNDNFIFVDNLDEKYRIKIISIKNRSVTSIFEYVFLNSYQEVQPMELIAVGNRFLIFYCRESYNWTPVAIFEPFGQSLKKVDGEFLKSSYMFCPLQNINKACTISFESSWDGVPHIHYFW